MRIATWNVNGLRARLEFVLHWLESRRPDVVGLQELKLVDDQFPHLALESLGYHAVVYGQKAWNGVAVLALEKPEIEQRGLPGQEALGARLVTVRVGGLRFTTVYAPNGKHVDHDDFPRKLAWFDSLRAHVAETAGDSTVLCGDFNICPTAQDTWREEPEQIFHTEVERSRFRAILDLGVKDVYRERHPDGAMFSWWDYRGGSFHRNMGLRIDFVLAADAVMERVESVEIDREYRKKQDGLTPSDHAPVIVDLR